MRRIDIPYGREKLVADIPPDRLAGVLEASNQRGGGIQAQQALIRQALDAPIGSPPLRDLAKGKQRILVITSDHTRPVPSALTLPLLLAEIRAGAPKAEIRILIATGTHRPMTEAEMRAKFGDGIVNNESLINHLCDDEGAMASMGTLPSGGELLLNGLVLWADLLVSEGFIEPHFFAGFSGGRKSVLPGIAARKTVLYNHNARFLQSPRAVQGNLEGNPLHRDMVFAARKAGLAFILNVLLDKEKRILEAFAGDPYIAHEKGCQACLAHTRAARVPGDIVITSNGGYPLDQNVYQAVKGMTAAEKCVRPGGVIIMCAALGDGAGGEAFFRWLADAPHPHAVREAIENIPPEETREDQWEAQILARVLCHAAVVFVTGEENRALVKAMHMTWAGDLNTAMGIAEARAGADARVAVIPDGVGVVVQG